MKLEIEITEEDAAALISNHWGQRSIAEIVQELAEDSAASFRRSLPDERATKNHE